MSTDRTLTIHRTHNLGLPAAQALAERWLQDALADYGIASTPEPLPEGAAPGQRHALQRSGLSGHLQYSAQHFDLTLQLGFLLNAHRERIREHIERNLDGVLAQASDREAG
jgi:putative polyhydroxyalkanoate system protein